MITFLPYPNFTLSATALDSRRLQWQVVEAVYILDGIHKGSHNPCVLMWSPFVAALYAYGQAFVAECHNRRLWTPYDNYFEGISPVTGVSLPPFVGDPLFHRSHRSMLSKKTNFYRWPILDTGYYWPIRLVEGQWIFQSLKYYSEYFFTESLVRLFKKGHKVLILSV